MTRHPRSAYGRRVALDARTRTLSFALLFLSLVWANAAGYDSTYPTRAERVRLIGQFADNKAARMLYGVGHDLATTSGYVAWRAGGLLALFAGLFGIFAATRAMRTDEDAGRTELVLAGAFTRASAFATALIGVGVTIAVVGVATALGAIAGGLAVGGSCFFALTLASVMVVYTAIGAVANQVFPTRRGALGAAATVLGIDFLVRVAADTTDHLAVHWVTPLGWAEELRAFTGSRAAVLLLPVAATVALLAWATALRVRRDLGAGYVASHDSADARPRLLGSPLGLAFRLDRMTIASWVVGVAAFAAVVGSVAKTVEKIQLPEAVKEQIAKLGGIDVTKAKGYVGLVFSIFVFAIGLFVCGQLGAARDEESAHRLETLFALPSGRAAWLGGRLGVALFGAALCAMGAGVAAGIGVAVTGGHMTFAEGLEAGVNVLPAEVLFLGLGALLYALLPRLGVGLLYAVVVLAFVWELFGALLGFPGWLLDVSPFHHVAPAPARPIAWTAASVMLALGVAAGAVGLARFRRRDLAGD